MADGLMHCVKCGSSLQETDSFCSVCGQKNQITTGIAQTFSRNQTFFLGVFVIAVAYNIITFLTPFLVDSIFLPNINQLFNNQLILALPNILDVVIVFGSLFGLFILFRKIKIIILRNDIKIFLIEVVACLGLSYLAGFIVSYSILKFFNNSVSHSIQFFYQNISLFTLIGNLPLNDFLIDIFLNLIFFEIYFSFFLFLVFVFGINTQIFRTKSTNYLRNNILMTGLGLLIGIIYSIYFIELRFRSLSVLFFPVILNYSTSLIIYYQYSLFIIPLVLTIIPITVFKLKLNKSSLLLQFGTTFSLVFIGYNLGLFIYVFILNSSSIPILDMLLPIISFSLTYGLNYSLVLAFSYFILLVVFQIKIFPTQIRSTSKIKISSKFLTIKDLQSTNETVSSFDNSLAKIEEILRENSE